MNKKPTVSVIIPVYGVEDYIEKCLQSLLDQTFTDFEAIIVDDGSLDQSIPIAKRLVRNDPRFIFLEKENGGQASARNMGLDYARGEYISFLDPDDSIDSRTYEFFYQNLINNKTSTEIFIFGMLYLTKGIVLHKHLPNIDAYYNNKDLLLSEGSINYSVCNKIFHKCVFDNRRFLESIIHEDKEITPKLLFKRKIFILDKYLYFYEQRPNSTMMSYNKKSFYSYDLIYKRYKDFLIKENIFIKKEEYYEKSYLKFCYFTEVVQLIKYSSNPTTDYRSVFEKIDKKILNDKKIISYFGFFSKYYLLYIGMKISPKLVVKIYKAIKQLNL